MAIAEQNRDGRASALPQMQSARWALASLSLATLLSSLGTSIASANHPANSIAGSATRTWLDTNGNFVPDCDLRSPLVNAECGALSNVLFGQSVITRRYADVALDESHYRVALLLRYAHAWLLLFLLSAPLRLRLSRKTLIIT